MVISSLYDVSTAMGGGNESQELIEEVQGANTQPSVHLPCRIGKKQEPGRG